MPSETDNIFYRRALELANTAQLATEECKSYVKGIKDNNLRLKAILEVNNILEVDFIEE